MQSTRGQDIASIDEAIRLGLARDGGLFVPTHFPNLSIKKFYEYGSFKEFCKQLMAPFFTHSQIDINDEFTQKVFNFPLPLHSLGKQSYALELFHGPTLSFKDLGAQFFSECLSILSAGQKTKVLVATSGDTGGAIAQALHGKNPIEGIILFPKDKITASQQAQITCWGDNIRALAVNGSFDQCQSLVKESFSKQNVGEALTTANSINIARLLPQMIFYAYSSIRIAIMNNCSVNYIVPSGNLGNVTACYWAKYLGFPIQRILIANNANHVLSDFLKRGFFKAKPSISTLANAMDVGDPSNLERLLSLFTSFEDCKKHMDVESVNDQQIKNAIISCFKQYHYLICPHTATAFHRLSTMDLTGAWVIVATAHPAKFTEVIEPLINTTVQIPASLKNMLSQKQHYSIIEPNYQSLSHYLKN